MASSIDAMAARIATSLALAEGNLKIDLRLSQAKDLRQANRCSYGIGVVRVFKKASYWVSLLNVPPTFRSEQMMTMIAYTIGDLMEILTRRQKKGASFTSESISR
ncbi:hypothetical protein ACLB2K_073834 [Fragaria x ananassa]